MQNFLKLWRMRCITHEIKIGAFKNFGLSKIIFSFYKPKIPKKAVHKLKNIREWGLCKNFNAKVKLETKCKNYRDGDLKK